MEPQSVKEVHLNIRANVVQCQSPDFIKNVTSQWRIRTVHGYKYNQPMASHKTTVNRATTCSLQFTSIEYDTHR